MERLATLSAALGARRRRLRAVAPVLLVALCAVSDCRPGFRAGEVRAAWAAYRALDVDAALEGFERLAVRTAGRDDLTRADILLGLGLSQHERSALLEEALPAFAAASRIAEDLYGVGAPETIRYLSWSVLGMRHVAPEQETLAVVDRWLAASVGPDHRQERADALHMRAMVMLDADPDSAAAIAQWERALAERELQARRAEDLYLMDLEHLAWHLFSVGACERAVETYEQVLERLGERTQPGPLRVARPRLDRGRALACAGRPAEAAALWDELEREAWSRHRAAVDEHDRWEWGRMAGEAAELAADLRGGTHAGPTGEDGAP